MEPLLSAIVGDMVSRALTMVINRYMQPRGAEHKLQRLQRLLLRIDAMVEEAEGRHITNQAMLRQLEMLRQGMYRGHYMLNSFRCRGNATAGSGGGGGGDDDEVSGGRRRGDISRLGSARRHIHFLSRFRSSTESPEDTALDSESVKRLDKMLEGIEAMIGDMGEFAVFLKGYPRICRQPYSVHLFLDKVMFGRQIEKEKIINFLLQPAAATSDGDHGVLPIVGSTRVGKSTLVEHVCLDDRVRSHFASIVLFTGDDLCTGNIATLRGSRVIKHQDDLNAPSPGRSLAVIELTGDIDVETWRSLYSSARSKMGHGSKIIITSRSEKIAALGTTHALRLKPLAQEAYWCLFKALAFGGANPDDQPKLASLAMEIAALLNCSFIGANVVGSLMRDNLNVHFWLRLLQSLRDFTSKHLLVFGEHPNDLMDKGRRVCMWRMSRSQIDVVICGVYQRSSSSTSEHDIPKLTSKDVLAASVPDQGSFKALVWRSNIPPYHMYLVDCVSQKVGCTSKKRPRHTRVHYNRIHF
ncbi:hypothetical protein ACP4OV_029359 [Aristida adscensionis]